MGIGHWALGIGHGALGIGYWLIFLTPSLPHSLTPPLPITPYPQRGPHLPHSPLPEYSVSSPNGERAKWT
ncbi:MAG: hypothetical protein V7K24_25460 [Nostoc sp.]